MEPNIKILVIGREALSLKHPLKHPHILHVYTRGIPLWSSENRTVLS